ncbi:AP endonuclease 1 [Blastomyces silverae]|uniref:Apurinic-apyrimidinic endonuclease 1 n=1 Tax=Blastomyces silverae TaxID=2060906 RepID=A0A0H1BUT2_9EURO|nr:AP endonuclease 1 [Blastomyces silverae]
MATRATRSSSRLASNTTPTKQPPKTEESISRPVNSTKRTSKRSKPIPSSNNINNKINGTLGVGPCAGADDDYAAVGTVEIEHTEEVTVEKKTVEISKRGTKRKATVSKSEQYSGEEEQEVEVKVRTEERTKRTKVKEATIEMKPLAPRTANLRMFVGAHISAAKGVHNAVTNSVHIGGNAFALFLKSQRKWENPPLQNEHRDQFRQLCSDYSYDASKYVLPHGSYLVNLAQEDPTKAKQAYNSFLDDLKRCEELGIKLYNFHPGATNQTTLESSLSRLAQALISALKATTTVVPVLETMCGHGTTIGGSLSHFKALLALIPDTYRSRIGICVDTCHSFAAGYDLRSPSSWNNFMEEFDKEVGLQYLRAFHLNDSKTPLGSRRDLHANIGTGFLGLRAFHNLMNDKRLEGIPMILETPIDRPAKPDAETATGQPDDEYGVCKDDHSTETTTKKKNSGAKKGPAKKAKPGKPVMIEDKSVWAKEIKLLESLIGMDTESEEFLRLEAELAEQGKEEREKHQAMFDKKRDKEAKQKDLRDMFAVNGKAKGKGKAKAKASTTGVDKGRKAEEESTDDSD